MPTSEQIAQILIPWRTQDQRQIASRLNQLGGGAIVWLRTNYADSLEERHQEFLESSDIDEIVDHEDFMLDDSACYNFEDRWEKVLHVLPEIVSSRTKNFTSEELVEALGNLNAFRSGGVDQAPRQILQNLATVSGEELNALVGQILLSMVHKECVATCLIVEDKQALQSGEILLLYLDFQGDVVRKLRLHVDYSSQVSGAWARSSWYETLEWEEAEIGENYREGETKRWARLLETNRVGTERLASLTI